MFKLVVLSALLALASAKPHLLTPVAYTGHHVAVAPAVSQITKTVHYASQPVVTGYSSTILKPNLGLGLATPSEIVSHERVLAPARSVATITPHVTAVQPEIHVQNVPIEVPVHTPVAVVETAPAVAVVKSVPTSVSHQSSTVVHSSANVVEAVAPAVYSAPAVVSSYEAPIYGARAVYGSPLAYSTYSSHGLVNMA